jgi:hypothetical protein
VPDHFPANTAISVKRLLPRSTLAQEFGLAYEGRSGLIALLDRLNLEYHKPNIIPHKLDEDRQQAFIEKPVRRN